MKIENTKTGKIKDVQERFARILVKTRQWKLYVEPKKEAPKQPKESKEPKKKYETKVLTAKD